MSSSRMRRSAAFAAAVLTIAGGGVVVLGSTGAYADTSTATYHCVPPALSNKAPFDTSIPITVSGPATAKPGQPITITAGIPVSGQTNPGPIALVGLTQSVDFNVSGTPATFTATGTQTGSIPIGAALPNPSMSGTFTPTVAGTYNFVPNDYNLGVDTGISGIGVLTTPCALTSPPAPSALTVTVAAASTKLPAPTGLKVTGTTPTSASLSWTGSAGATGYKVYNGTTLAGTVTGTTDTVTGLTPATGYTFTVLATDGTPADDSPASTAVTVTTPAQPAAPPAPTGLRADSETSTSVSLSWTGSAGATGYKVYNGTTLAGTVTDTTDTVTGLTPGTGYTFTVVAGNSAGDSPASAAVTATTTAGGGGTVSYSSTLKGSTFIKAPNGTATLAGSVAAKLDRSTGAYTANLVLSPTTGNFKIFDFLPVTASIAFSQVGDTTGTYTGGVLAADSKVNVAFGSFDLFGLPIGGGPSCQTTSPADIKLTSTQPSFNPRIGGPIAGTYTLPAIADCGSLTPLLSAVTAGPGNTINLNLAPAT